MTDIIITLGRGRTKVAAFDDAAIANGWTGRINELQEKTVTLTYSELKTAGTGERYLSDQSIDFERIIDVVTPQNAQPTDIVTIYYESKVSVLNPVSQQEFGKQVWAKKIDSMDREAAGSATLIRDEKSEADGVTTIVS